MTAVTGVWNQADFGGTLSIRRAGRKRRPPTRKTRERSNNEGLHRKGWRGGSNAALHPRRSPSDYRADPLTDREGPFQRKLWRRRTHLWIPLRARPNPCRKRGARWPIPMPIPITAGRTADPVQRHDWLGGYPHSLAGHKRESPQQMPRARWFSRHDNGDIPARLMHKQFRHQNLALRQQRPRDLPKSHTFSLDAKSPLSGQDWRCLPTAEYPSPLRPATVLNSS